jgi:hypothetical protein
MGKKKIEIPEDVLSEMIRLYNEDYIGTPSLSDRFGYHKSIILRSFKDKGVQLGPSGRKWTGGKEEAAKKYHSKPEVKKRKSDNHKIWSEKNREHLREYHTKWREENREDLNEYKRVYEKTKKDSDPSYRLACYTRTAVYTCLKERDVTKYKSTFDLLPYSLEELILHLESQFKEGMIWDNYGEWHVDHIKPMASFNIQSPEDKSFQECWSLDNLQPLWGVENLSKGSRYLLV